MENKGGGKPSTYRAGKRKDRNQRAGTRIPELGYYLIVTDTTATEKNYFEGLRNTIPEDLRNRLVIKMERADTDGLIKHTLDVVGKESQYRIPWIVFDRDQVRDFDVIIQTAEEKGIHVGWSNPCFEIWLYAYLGEMPSIKESNMCCTRFAEKFMKITGQEYHKNDKDIYRKLVKYGNEEKAIRIAERCLNKFVGDKGKKPSNMWPASTVQQLVDEIQKKIGENGGRN